MVFYTKRDTGITIFVFIVDLFILFCGVIGFLLPSADNLTFNWIILIVFLIIEAGVMWMYADIKYIFKDDCLFVKGGPFRSHIPYENIYKVDEAPDILVGFRLLASTDAIQVFFNGKRIKSKSVKISPMKREEFLKELQSRNPQIKMNKSCWHSR